MSQCPVGTPRDIASGLLVCAILLGYTEEAKRLIPECLSFLRAIAVLYSQPSSGDSSVGGKGLGTVDVQRLSWLRQCAASSTSSSSSSSSTSSISSSSGGSDEAQDQLVVCEFQSKIPWVCFAKISDAREGRVCSWAQSILSTSQTLTSSIVTRHASSSAFPELLAPLIDSLRVLRPQDGPNALPLPLQQAHAFLLQRALATAEKHRMGRRALQWRKVETKGIETKAPKFQLDYTFKKDADPDADRVQMKQLTRQLKREKKAAMRELRRDSEFLDRERFKEKTEAGDQRRNERAKNFAFMEQQQSEMNMQVRKGGELVRGGGSAAAKKARVKRR